MKTYTIAERKNRSVIILLSSYDLQFIRLIGILRNLKIVA
jgi:hypothetical protein